MALAAHLPQQLQSHRVEAAIDEHDEPCYAKTPELRMYTCRSKSKAGAVRRSIEMLYCTVMTPPDTSLIGEIMNYWVVWFAGCQLSPVTQVA